jgi:hypothetical protein
MDVPTKLDNAIDPPHVCAAFDVYFKGKLQRDCIIADAKRGYIKRYRRIYGLLARNRAQQPMVEEVYGPVVIVPKGQPPGF